MPARLQCSHSPSSLVHAAKGDPSSALCAPVPPLLTPCIGRVRVEQDGEPGVPAVPSVPAKTAAAVQTAQYLANFFVNLARNNTHQFATALDEARALISQQMTLEFHHVTNESETPYLYPEGAYLFGGQSS